MNKYVYIAGPMRGIPLFNFPAFDAAANKIRSYNHIPINPAELDRKAGFDPATLPEDYDWSQVPDTFDLDAARTRDIEVLNTADEVWVLPGWRSSIGAKAEIAYAIWCDKLVRFIGTGSPIKWRGTGLREVSRQETSAISPREYVCDEAKRLTCDDRNKDYGDPLADFDRIADMWSTLLDHTISPHEVAAMMICLKLSRLCESPGKADNWVDIAGYAACGAHTVVGRGLAHDFPEYVG